MTDLKPFFEAIDLPVSPGEWGMAITAYHNTDFPDWAQADLVLVGLPFDGEGKSPSDAPEAIRDALYALAHPAPRLRVTDLGNLRVTDLTMESEAERLAYVLSVLHQQQKTVILLGGNQALTMAQLAGLPQALEKPEYVHIDNRLDLLDSGLVLDERSFNHRILSNNDFDGVVMSHLGYQQYLIPESEKAWLRNLHIPALRYGLVSERPEEAEPALRTCHAVSFDLAAVRASEAPGSATATPGGFDPVEACRLARFSGMGYHLLSFGLYGYQPGLDPTGRGAQLLAMLAWYVAEGMANRIDDHPKSSAGHLQRFSVHVNASIPPIAFFKHNHTGRWWMEVPHPDDLEQLSPRVRLVACTENDYETARKDDIPERWWQAFQRR